LLTWLRERSGGSKNRRWLSAAPRPRSLAAVCDDPDVQRAIAGGAVLAVVPLVFDRD
jgi:hypothetical protein